MSDPSAQRYVLDGEHECDRLERQAVLAGIETHLRYIPVTPGVRILDAGCGSGSMSRLLASRHQDATVIGLDLNPRYVTHARKLAEREGLANLTYRQGDMRALPFETAAFDLMWSC